MSSDLKKGLFNHVCLTLNKQDSRENNLQFFLNESLVAESKNSVKIKKINIDDADFLIGSGSSFYSNSTLVTPTQTFSGSLDELRVFHSVRDISQQKLFASRGIYSSPDLKLYYRFNEPSGSLSLGGSSSVDSIVLDSSGNSLHSNINNFSYDMRLDVVNDANNILTNELDEHKTVLFPAYQDIIDLNANLLLSASEYDRNNPNNIIKLVPKHYLQEGALQDGFQNIEGNGGDPYTGEGIPGQGKRGSVQIILSFLYIWSKFFDEIKTYIDAFVTLKTVRYSEEDSIPDNFLEDLVRTYGFNLPKFFNHSTVEQFTEGQNVDGLNKVDLPLKKIQSLILRRVLANMPDIIKSKGTQHSIRSFLRSVGIDPDNSLRIREYGGPSVKQLSSSREKRMEPGAMVDFVTSSLVTTSPLSGSRVEPGFPLPAGTFYIDQTTKRNAGTTVASDGLLTSGSWHLESVFKIPPQKLSQITEASGNQSLMRMFVTGSASTSQPGLVLNVIATQYSEYPDKTATIKAFLRPGTAAGSPVLEMSMDMKGPGIFDGDKWNISVGCVRNDSIGMDTSSQYYLRAAKSESGEIDQVYVTSSYFYEKTSTEDNVLRDVSSSNNVSVCATNGIGLTSWGVALVCPVLRLTLEPLMYVIALLATDASPPLAMLIVPPTFTEC